MEGFKLGEINRLTVARQEAQGMYLRGDDELNQVLLPNAYIAEGLKIGDDIDVFIYFDNEERIIATTLKPKIELNNFAPLVVEQVNRMGAFVDMGIMKQLLVPYKEQEAPMEEGRTYLVYMYIDSKSGRLVGTTKLGRFLDNEHIPLEKGDEVELMVLRNSSLGVNVMINEMHTGLIFENDVNQPLKIGQKLVGFIKTIREDNKIDVVLQREGTASFEPNTQKVVDVLNANGGTLNLHDKSDPAEISKVLLMSKKAFKKAVGNLYRARKIELVDGGIKLM